jgi:predicted NBD/HSP70 family sugar kinase
VVGNDADLAVLAEHQRGVARDADDVVFLLGRIGVGAGIMSSGVPLRGRDGHAGEIGHNVLDPAGPPCHCGNRGCIEAFIGDAALLATAGRPGSPAEGAVASLLADARAGHEPAAQVVRGAAEPLGRTIANLLNTLNPERVVLGGSLAALLELTRDDVQASVERYTFGGATRGVQLVVPALGQDASLLGAAEVAFTDLLSDPR